MSVQITCATPNRITLYDLSLVAKDNSPTVATTKIRKKSLYSRAAYGFGQSVAPCTNLQYRFDFDHFGNLVRILSGAI